MMLYEDINKTVSSFSYNKCIHELFEEQVKHSSDAIAVVFDKQSLTYCELNHRANQLAHYLRMKNVGPETPVGICMERSLEMIVGLLGILKSGGAYLPLDPTYPVERLSFMIENAKAPLLITQPHLMGHLSDQDAEIVCLPTDWEIIACEPSHNPLSEVDTMNLAYVMYTSGSTGKPKGVMVEHRQVVALLNGFEYFFPAGEPLVGTSVCRFNFDVSACEFFSILCFGGVLHILLPSILVDPDRLADYLVHNQITSAFVPPGILMHVCNRLENWQGQIALNRFFVGLEPIAQSILERFAKLSKSLRIINCYGPTEAAIWSTFFRFQGATESNRRTPIGKAVPGYEIYIADADYELMPQGKSGQLLIGGLGVARGYQNRPDLTAEQFMPDPYAIKPGQRLYQSGDLAHYLPDGNIEFESRMDHQVKIRGFRVELGEIEAVLLTHQDVREVVTIAQSDLQGDKRLVSYVVPKDGKSVSVSSLRSLLQKKLPEYMVPSVFVIMERLPVTPNGKIDRKALPDPDKTCLTSKRDYVEPQTPLEKRMAHIWSQILGVAPIGLDDHFFELGGHSILAIQLITQIHEVFKTNATFPQLFEIPTVKEMVSIIEKQKDSGEYAEKQILSWSQVTPSLTDRYSPFPLTDVQQAYWIGRNKAFELGNIATHQYAELKIQGLDLQRYEEAWRLVIKRHEMLRAIILPDGRQKILEQVPPFKIEVLDLRGFTPQAIFAEMLRIREQMSHQMLPTEQWPLFKIQAVILGNDWIQLHMSFDVLNIDAWSMEIIKCELDMFYRDPQSVLPPLELSFRDYVLAEGKLRGSEVYRRSLEYWQNRIKTLASAPQLPLVKNPSSIKKPHFVRLNGILEAEDWKNLKARSARSGLTPSVVLFTAFAKILALWSKSARFTINMTLFNRLPLHPQVNDIVGDFISLILLETDLTQKFSFVEQARSIQKQLWKDMDHRYVGGVQVLREIMQTQGGMPQAMMPVVFTCMLINSGIEEPDKEEKEEQGISSLFETVYSISQTPQVWLDHQVEEREGTLHFYWDAVEDLFPEGLLDEMIETYCQLLKRLAKDEIWTNDREQVLLPAAQLRQWTEVNSTECESSEELLHTLFAAKVKKQPEAPAVLTSSHMFTYLDLYQHSNQVGHWLRKNKVKPNTLVGVVMEKGWEQVVAVLGILAAGAAYLPIDPNMPKVRLWYLLKQGEVEYVLTQTWLEDKLEWPEGIERLSVNSEDCKALNSEPLAPIQTPADLAYVIFTSGSTGEPKGVMINHQGAVNTILDINERFHIKPQDRILGLSAFNFDLSVYDIFGILAAGAALVLPDADGGRDPAHWVELMKIHKVSLWNTVPALMEMLVEHTSGREERLPEKLRLVFMSGDWIPLTLPERIRKLAQKEIKLYSGGGATEASIWSILYPIEKIDPDWSSIPYGKPMRNQKFYVLDDHFNLRPAWVPGHLYIGGIGLAQGYWRDDVKTSKSFILNPESGERIYRTGDLGRYLPDGNIEFLGREDTQVKIRGHRIELGEVEVAMLQHPAVDSGVVIALGELRGDKYLVAYVVLHKCQTFSYHILQEYLKERLPNYMVPSDLVILKTLPLTANGKVDRQALPYPKKREIGLQKTYEAPRTPSEKKMVTIWQEVLGIERIGIHDNFFEFGGHSLMATQVISRIRQVFGLELSIRAMFEYPTVEGLARVIDVDFKQEERVSDTDIIPVERGKTLPLSFSQERLWFLDQLAPNNAAFNSPFAFHLTGELDVSALELSIGEVVQRHEVLRTTFKTIDGQTVLDIAPTWHKGLHTIDLFDLSPIERKHEIQRLTAEEIKKPFDLTHGPLLRANLMRLSKTEFILLLNAHHIAFDGWSQGIFLKELMAIYKARLEGNASPLPRLAIQYFDYGVWQRKWVQTRVLESDMSYWKEQLKGVPAALEFPTDYPRPVVQTYNGSSEKLRLSRALFNKLEQLSQEEGVTIFVTLLSALKVLLFRYSGQSDIVIGTPIANRTRTEVENLIGLFVNPLALRTDLSGNPSFQELLGRVHEGTLGAYDHQDLPFEKLVEELQPERDLTRTPIFQVMFIMQNEPEYRFELPGLTIREDELEVFACQFDMVLDVRTVPEGLEGRMEYNCDLFKRDTISRLVENFRCLLEDICNDPSQTLASLRLMPQAQEQQLLAQWNATETEYPHHKCIHELFEEQAERTPSSIAATCMGQHLSYHSLNQQADHFAWQLREQGVGAEMLVGLLADRGLLFLTTMLGIFKAGGAYLPLDPHHPVQRYAQLLSQSHVSLILVTHSFLEVILESVELMPSESRPKVLVIEDLLESEDTKVDQKLPVRSNTDNLAYVIYTSGSTGTPKGVMVEQRGMVNHLYAKISDLQLTAEDHVAQTASQCFDISVWQFLSPLLVGGQTHIYPDEIAHDPQVLLERVEKDSISILETVPSLMQVMLEQVASFTESDRPKPTKLRWMVPTGEALPPELCRRWFNQYPNIPLMNAYGPTECSDDVTHYAIHEPPLAHVMHMSIGRPIQNTRMYILDDRLTPMPIGAVGGLYVGGDGVGRGYLERPELTADQFVPDPFSDRSGARLYKTGDQARYLSDGTIEYLGRIDHQVKIRGFRIELGEIEAVLTEHPKVRETVVMARDRIQDAGQTCGCEQRSSRDLWLVAYVVPKELPGPKDEDLLRFVKAKLPDYMAPSIFVLLEAMPLMPSGKVNRRALPVPDISKDNSPRRVTTIEESFYIPQWHQAPFPDHDTQQTTGRWLLFVESKGFSKALVRQLETNGYDVILVRKGKQFSAKKNTYTIRSGYSKDYETLIARLQDQDKMPDTIIHLWNLHHPGKKAIKQNDKVLQHSFFSLLFLAQALSCYTYDNDVHLVVISSHMQKIYEEEMIYPEKAALLGIGRVIQQEIDHVVFRSIDIELPKTRSQQEAQLVDLIITEIESDSLYSAIAYRGTKRLIQNYKLMSSPEISEAAKPMLSKGGVYLIVDGPEGLGSGLARYLARTIQARIVLISSIPLPEAGERQEYLKTHDPNDPGCLLIQAVQELSALGLPGLTMLADVTNAVQMKAAVEATYKRFGTISGVIYTAGSLERKMISAENTQSISDTLSASVQGVWALEAALQKIPMRFLLLCSPLSSLVGGRGQSAHCAGSAFKAAFAQMQSRNQDSLTMAVYWDMENEIGVTDNNISVNLSQQQGELLARLMTVKYSPRIVISSHELPALMEQSSQFSYALKQGRNFDGVADCQNTTEEKIATIWQDLLGLQKVKRDDSFFKVGGHSLVAIQLINKVRETFKVSLPVRASFEAPTIAELAQYIDQARGDTEKEVSNIPLEPVRRDGALALSPAQQGLWKQIIPQDSTQPIKKGLWGKLTTAFKSTAKVQQTVLPNLVAWVHLKGKLNHQILKQSIGDIARRHEILRTYFPKMNGSGSQVITPESKINLVVKDFTKHSNKERENVLERLLTEQIKMKLNPAHGDLWQMVLIVFGAQEHVLVLTLHPLIADERSMELLIEELTVLYKAAVTNELPNLPFLSVQYGDYAAWQLEWLKGSVLDKQLSYWKEQWGEGIGILRWPHYKQQAAENFRRAIHPFTLSAKFRVALESLSKQEDSTLFVTLLTMFKVWLYHQTGQSDLAVGTLVDNRKQAEISKLIGRFGNCLLLRTNFSHDTVFRDLIKQVKQVTSDAFTHQDVPFEILQDTLSPGRPLTFQTMFNFNNNSNGTQSLPGLSIGAPAVINGGREVDLMLKIHTQKHDLRAVLEYNAALFDPATIAQWEKQLQALMKSIVADPGQPLSELALEELKNSVDE